MGASSLHAADAGEELNALIQQIKAKLSSGAPTESALAPELKKFDDLLKEHAGEKTDAVAQILYMKAQLYSEVFKNQPKADELTKQLLAEYGNTNFAKQVKEDLAHKAKMAAIQAELVVGKTFPDFQKKDVNGNPLSISALRGKVVLVDFWATWCPPCREEIPNLVTLYKKYHDNGFEIVGVSLDDNKQQLLDFAKANGMVWPLYFDPKGGEGELPEKYGIEEIPATFLLDRSGKIIALNLRGEETGQALAKALGK